MNDVLDNVMEMDAVAQPPLTKICNHDAAHTVKSVGQCGVECPDFSGDHRGVCYLDWGHSSNHKCSVDGREWG
jgi:hypothetical protein